MPQREDKYFGDTFVYKRTDECQTTSELATVLQTLFLVLAENADENQSLIDELAIQIKDVASLVPSASFQLGISGKQVIIYPRGDDLLDQGIINCVLAGLENFPQAAKPFENALNIYQSGQSSQYRNLLDDLRFSLETLLKNVLNNQKSLENQQQELLRWLKNKNLHPQIVNLYQQLLFGQYRLYQNDAVKHDENYSIDEVEFAIYLTGNFMRFILQLHGE